MVVTVRRLAIAAATLVVIVAAAIIVDRCSYSNWTRDVFAAADALQKTGTAANLKVSPTHVAIRHGYVLLIFEPPITKWTSRVFGSVDYDTYTIEIQCNGTQRRVHVHHGSD